MLRIYHGGLQPSFRRREAEMTRLGARVTLVSAHRWDEGGAVVPFAADPEIEAHAAAAIGRHPARFVYDPRPIIRALRRHRFDVIDAHEEPFSLALAEVLLLRALFARRTPVVCYTAQNLDKRFPIPFRWLERLALRSVAAVYPCSRGAAGVMARKGATGIVQVLPLGVDLTRFTPGIASAPAVNDGHTPLRVGYVGRLAVEKGVDVLLRAVDGTTGLEVRIVGAGKDEERLRAMCDSAGRADRAYFGGFVAHEALPDLYRGFDVLVVPSLPTPRWTEQFCRVAVEAMACGVPVVCSDAGALPEVVGDGGVVVEAGDPVALRRALEGLRDDPTRRHELRDRAIARASTYSWAEVAAQHLEIYARVVSGR